MKVFNYENGNKVWESKAGDSYLVTGKDKSGKRFRVTYDSWHTANCINLWEGSKWLVRDGKKHLIVRVVN